MAEYVSREAALKAFKLIAKNPNKDYQRGMQDTIDCLVPEVIADIPSADVQPVKHGRWVSEKVRKPNWKGVEHDYFQPNSCSVCHTGFAVRSNYCPNCGARMMMDGDTQ